MKGAQFLNQDEQDNEFVCDVNCCKLHIYSNAFIVNNILMKILQWVLVQYFCI